MRKVSEQKIKLIKMRFDNLISKLQLSICNAIDADDAAKAKQDLDILEKLLKVQKLQSPEANNEKLDLKIEKEKLFIELEERFKKLQNNQ